MRRSLRSPTVDFTLLSLALLIFAALALGPRLALPFVGDDYVFLDNTRAATFGRLWSPTESVEFGWYRPWAREVHFWALQNLVGVNSTAFRLFNLALWTAMLCLYAAIVARLSSPGAAGIATLGVASLALWGTPLLWISGSQDLWMLMFVLLGLWLFISGREVFALVAFVFALLSKETAAVLPLLVSGYLFFVERCSVRRILERTWSLWSVLLAWALLHPTLRQRLFGGLASTAELEHRPPGHVILFRSVAAWLNLDRLPHPQELDAVVISRIVLSALLLAAGVVYVARRHGVGAVSPDSNRAWRFAVAWTVVGVGPVFLPSIGWHAYYSCVGALGAWFGIALWLQTRVRLAVALIAALAVLRGAHAYTVSTDWGDEAYIQIAGNTLGAIRDELMRQHPTLPPHSRVYFTGIPYRIGLIAGQSPALRVWYADSTLQAGYYSYYRPRGSGAAAGSDYFFRFDPSAGMVQIKAGPEDLLTEQARNPRWEDDHQGLATLMVAKRDPARASSEFEKLSQLPHRPDAAVFAAVSSRLAGDTLRADSLLRAVRPRLRGTAAEMNELMARVERRMRERMERGE
jgi:hypothetical protein